MKFTLAMQTQISGIPWRYDFTRENAETAYDFIRRILHPGSFPANCMEVQLWDVTTENAEKLIRRWKANTVVVEQEIP